MEDIVIVGAGQSAGQCVVSLRNGGFKGSITIIGEESHPPYQRPPLSKGYLSDKVGIDRVYTKPESFYQENEVNLLLSKRVETIDREENIVLLSNGDSVKYKKLVLATGSRVRKLNVAGSHLSNIHYLRDIQDADDIKHLIKSKKKLVVVGAGYIGLEVAAVATESGLAVTVIEMAERVMNRTVDPLISEYYKKLHENHGVEIHLNTPLEAFGGTKSVSKVFCSNLAFNADCVVVGAGILPNQEIALNAGLKCDNGIWVDEFCKTEDDNIYACGDCTNHPNKSLNTRLRLESVHNALEQGKTVASSLLEKNIAYNQVPWFWSDQYDHKLQIIGISGDHDKVVKRGNEENSSFLLFYLKNNKLIAVDAVNNPKEFMICKKLVANKIKISSDNISDLSINLSELLS